MDVSGVALATTGVGQADITNAVQMTVLRKALDIQAQAALELIQAVPQPTSNPPNLGNRVDTFA